jgi:heme/copper-type cytochrome/quinol oxidase subunit 3
LIAHPGGAAIIVPYCGGDATQAFATKDKRPGKDHSQMAHEMLLGMFWHFLDIIWIFIFTIVYLIGTV